MTTAPPPPPGMPAGWYPNGDVQRYWDGAAWTEHTAPLAAPPAPAAAPAPTPAPAPVPEPTSGAPLLQFTSHIAGKNAQVTIYPTHVEWERAGKFGALQAGAAMATMGASLATKSGRAGSKGAGSEMIPIKSISSVTTRKDGFTNWAVSIIASGNTIDMRVSREEAEQIKATLLRLMTA